MIWVNLMAIALSLSSLALSLTVMLYLRDMERKRRAMRGPYSQPYRHYQSTRQTARKR
jgi:hypothetical protein